MRSHKWIILFVLLPALLAACGPGPTPTPNPQPYGTIQDSRGDRPGDDGPGPAYGHTYRCPHSGTSPDDHAYA